MDTTPDFGCEKTKPICEGQNSEYRIQETECGKRRLEAEQNLKKQSQFWGGRCDVSAVCGMGYGNVARF